MARLLTLTALALVATTAPAAAAGITGQYVEARTCDVWTGPCFANADFNLTGKNAVMAWRVDKGTVDNVSLDGLGVVAVHLGQRHARPGTDRPGRAVLIVDSRASAAQREPLSAWPAARRASCCKTSSPSRARAIDLNTCQCKGEACAELQAGAVQLKTRCLDAAHDKACGNETRVLSAAGPGRPCPTRRRGREQLRRHWLARDVARLRPARRLRRLVRGALKTASIMGFNLSPRAFTYRET